MPGADPYTEVPYPARAFPRTHPDHLALLATLHELSPADPDRCRVVELACGDGMNVVPMAAAALGVTVAGVDRHAGAIARGREAVAALDLSGRVELRVGDLLDPEATAGLGEADYVICHGLYSWAPAEVREAALSAMVRLLAPRGVAFLSFTVRPGGLARRILGESLARHADRTGARGARERADAARELLAFAERWTAEREDPYGALLDRERRRVDGQEDGLLVHDDLEAETTALWHGDVEREAGRHGLRILCDADPAALRDDWLPPGFAAAAAELAPGEQGRRQGAGDQGGGRRQREAVHRQELADVLSGRPYREVVLVREEAPAADAPTAAGVARLRAGPGRRRVAELAAEAGESPEALGARLLAGLRDGSVGLHDYRPGPELRLHAAPARHAADPGERPVGYPLARWQARRGADVTTLLHTRLTIRDEAGRVILALCDGTRDREALAADAAAELAPLRGDDAEALRGRLSQAMDRSLARLAAGAALVPGSERSGPAP